MSGNKMQRNDPSPDERLEIFRNNGNALGYPKCCIDQFCNEFQTGQFLNKSAERKKVGTLHGFVPCQEHAEEILAGKIQVESLIVNRDPSLRPFPDE